MRNLMFYGLMMTLLLTSCATPSPLNLGGEWKLVSYGLASQPTSALPGVDTVFTFENGQLSGNVGCNGFGGTYELQGETISFSGIISTMMYCEETSAQEQGVLAVLNENPQLRVKSSGSNLVFESQDGLTVMILERK